MSFIYSNLCDLFTGIAQQYPDRIAVKDRHDQLSYRDLYARALQAAGIVRRHCKPSDRVVLISNRNNETIIALWGILLYGAIPVILDQEDGIPDNERKIAEVKPVAVIMDKVVLTPDAKFSSLPVLGFRDLSVIGEMAAASFMPAGPSADAICYMLMTSGTTGNPKAVQITHENVMHYTRAICEKIASKGPENAAHVSTFSADLGLTNFLVALATGGMLRILNKAESTDPAVFNRILQNDDISLLKMTPSHIASLMAENDIPYRKPIRTLILGGEKLSWQAVRKLFEIGFCKNLYNHYGPTETTVGALSYKVDMSSPHFGRTDSVPLGSALGQGVCFIDPSDKDVGELYIAGPGVGPGYYRNEVESRKRYSKR
jgi:non-ribosomal peptide synthetase component F